MEKIISEEQATIYLSARRGCTVRTGLQSWHTLNFGDYFNKHRTPFFDLRTLNDEMLNTRSTTQYEINADIHFVLIPVVGGVSFQIDGNTPGFVEAGQCVRLGLRKGSILKITNTFNETVNYLVLQFRSEDFVPQFIKEGFDIDQSKDSLTRIFSSPSGFIGKFSGRFDATFKPSETSQGVFVFVIEGAFEFQNRLLEARDALTLTGAVEIDFEALSSGAILLIIDL